MNNANAHTNPSDQTEENGNDGTTSLINNSSSDTANNNVERYVLNVDDGFVSPPKLLIILNVRNES